MEELKAWQAASGLPVRKFFNTSGMLYKEMHLKEKLADMSEEEQLQLLSTNGMLVKRPLVVNGDQILVGFKEADWEDKLRTAVYKSYHRTKSVLVQSHIHNQRGQTLA